MLRITLLRDVSENSKLFILMAFYVLVMVEPNHRMVRVRRDLKHL